MAESILIIDDEDKLRKLLHRVIALEGFFVKEARDLRSARQLMEKETPAVILCDVKLPDGNGVDFTKEAKAAYPGTEIILLTAYGNVPDGVQAMRNGAFDYIQKGDDNDKIIPLLHRALEKIRMSRKVEQLQGQISNRYSFSNIIGNTPAILNVIALAKKVAATDTTVLIQGETGTGKEVFAQSIHYAGPRAAQNFVAVNCSAFSKELLESELFGHKAGAFTGAVKDKKGLFEEADGGTLFMDELGEMPAELQSRLLRVLENGEFIKVGDTVTKKVNVRIIAATNRDLHQCMLDGSFRQDLFYRLSVFQLSIPPLRERVKDIPDLCRHFVTHFARKTNKPVPAVSKTYIEALQQYQWPGNIRELKNVIERSVILENGPELSTATLFFPDGHAASEIVQGTVSYELASVEKTHIRKVLEHTGGNKTEAARLLGIGLTTLYRKIEEYDLH